MRVVDTSLWIELISEGKLLSQAREVIEPLQTCLVPTIVHYELSKWSGRVLSSEGAKAVLTLLTDCTCADLNLAIAVEAALLSTKYKLHATDAMIYATAQLYDATLFTCDAHFKDLPGVEYLEK